jgi:hypothetical protein
MIEKKFKKTGITHYDYKNTVWFKAILTENNFYKYKLMISVILVALVIPVALFFAESVNSGSTLLMNFLIPFCLMLIFLFFLVKFKKKINGFPSSFIGNFGLSVLGFSARGK